MKPKGQPKPKPKLVPVPVPAPVLEEELEEADMPPRSSSPGPLSPIHDLPRTLPSTPPIVDMSMESIATTPTCIDESATVPEPALVKPTGAEPVMTALVIVSHASEALDPSGIVSESPQEERPITLPPVDAPQEDTNVNTSSVAKPAIEPPVQPLSAAEVDVGAAVEEPIVSGSVTKDAQEAKVAVEELAVEKPTKSKSTGTKVHMSKRAPPAIPVGRVTRSASMRRNMKPPEVPSCMSYLLHPPSVND